VKLNKGQFKVRGFQICVCSDCFPGLWHHAVLFGVYKYVRGRCHIPSSLVFEVSGVRLQSGYKFPTHTSRLLGSMCCLCFTSATLTLSK